MATRTHGRSTKLSMCLFLLVVVLSTLSACGPKVQTGNIEGRVIDASTDAPLAGANVVTDPPTYSLTTDEQGRYVIPAVTAGTYNVTAEKYGYQTRDVTVNLVQGVTITADLHLASDSVPYSKPGGLVAYYPFHGSADDTSGNGNHGIVFGGATLTADRFGRENEAYSLDGVDDYIASSLPVTLGPEHTVTMWIRYPAGAKAGEIFSRGERQDCLYGPGVTLAPEGLTASGLSCLVRGPMGTVEVANDFWYLIAVVMAGRSEKLYVNGEEMAVGESYPAQAAVRFLIGAATHNEQPVDFFQGIVDDVRVYNRALGSAEIKALYHEYGWEE